MICVNKHKFKKKTNKNKKKQKLDRQTASWIYTEDLLLDFKKVHRFSMFDIFSICF